MLKNKLNPAPEQIQQLETKKSMTLSHIETYEDINVISALRNYILKTDEQLKPLRIRKQIFE
jgi:hypothetical protein